MIFILVKKRHSSIKLTNFSEDIFEDVVRLEDGNERLHSEDTTLQVLLAFQQETEISGLNFWISKISRTLPDCYELLGGNVLEMVDEELDELKEFLLHASRLCSDLLCGLAERVLVLEQEVVGVVPVVDGGDGVQDGSTQARGDAFHEDRL